MKRWKIKKVILVMKTAQGISFIGILAAFALLASLVSGSFAAPKKVTTAKPGDCAACHESKKLLPSHHENTKDMNYESCAPCHPKTGTGSLRTKMPGSHAHSLAGVTCEKCHEKGEMQEAPEMKQCLSCHNPEKLVEKTAKVKPENPPTPLPAMAIALIAIYAISSMENQTITAASVTNSILLCLREDSLMPLWLSEKKTLPKLSCALYRYQIIVFIKMMTKN